ncbi:survival motor neuron interacting protein 1-domain-containing protein [Cladochytrium replicatum]|nr:survival motor neuron interacting protein 1-domain-containing protein [Cladochytrium replicatum]
MNLPVFRWDDAGLLRRALPLDLLEEEQESNNEEAQDGDSPATALQYLRSVRSEALTCPQVVVAEHLHQNLHITTNFREEYFERRAHEDGLSRIGFPDYLIPSEKWRYAFLQDFNIAKTALQKHCATKKRLKRRADYAKDTPFPPLEDINGWKILCYGPTDTPPSPQRAPSDASDMEEGELEDLPSTSPIPTLVLLERFDQQITLALLQHHLRWISDTDLSSAQSKWLFALLLRLNPLLEADAVSLLRRLARKLFRLRRNLVFPEGEGESVQISAVDPRMIGINTALTVIAHVFGQKDMIERRSGEVLMTNEQLHREDAVSKTKRKRKEGFNGFIKRKRKAEELGWSGDTNEMPMNLDPRASAGNPADSNVRYDVDIPKGGDSMSEPHSLVEIQKERS